MTCAKCNADVEAGERFCGECGQPVSAVAAPPSPSNFDICPNCGAKREPDKRFCGECGKDLRTAPPDDSVQPSSATTSNISTIPGKSTEPAPKRRRRTYALATIVGIVVVAGLGFIGYQFFFGQEKRFFDSVVHNDVRALKSYLAAGMNPNTRSDGSGFTPLILAADFGHTEIVKTLIASGADVNAHDGARRTALWWAAYTGLGDSVGTVKALVAGGADVNMKDKHGATALMAAQARGHTHGPELVRILQEAGAKE